MDEMLAVEWTLFDERQDCSHFFFEFVFCDLKKNSNAGMRAEPPKSVC
jgi:hypothetical protein